MLEDNIGHKKKSIKSRETKVYLDAEYDPGIKPGGLSIKKKESTSET